MSLSDKMMKIHMLNTYKKKKSWLPQAFVDTVDHILDDVNLGAWKTSDDADIVTQQLTSVVASSENMALSMARARRRLDQKTDSTTTSTNQSISFNKTNIGNMCD